MADKACRPSTRLETTTSLRPSAAVATTRLATLMDLAIKIRTDQTIKILSAVAITINMAAAPILTTMAPTTKVLG